jgi:hypothetical protein
MLCEYASMRTIAEVSEAESCHQLPLFVHFPQFIHVVVRVRRITHSDINLNPHVHVLL